ncbi:hypothetical protein, partial [Burkholderia sp. ABCPW 14]|uniref:hypothetical protein n=1 Tax=Burkholderia sp. ABCPW 14 TaxID=1637860 RepID=UPI000A79E31C
MATKNNKATQAARGSFAGQDHRTEAVSMHTANVVHLLRITESMTTDFLPVRYTVITLNGGSVDGQNGRSYAQAGACW